MKVKECMSGEVCWVRPDTKVYEIAKIMNQNHIGCVPVCDNQNTLVGIITDIVMKSKSVILLTDKLGITPEQFGMKCGMLTGMLFPLVGI